MIRPSNPTVHSLRKPWFLKYKKNLHVMLVMPQSITGISKYQNRGSRCLTDSKSAHTIQLFNAKLLTKYEVIQLRMVTNLKFKIRTSLAHIS